jgi:hypothetical protein
MPGLLVRSVLMAGSSRGWRHRWLEPLSAARCAEVLRVLDHSDAADILAGFKPSIAAKIILAPSGQGKWLPRMPGSSAAAVTVEVFRANPGVAVERVAETSLNWIRRLLPSLDSDAALLPAVFGLLPDSHKLVLAAVLRLSATRLSALWPQWRALRAPWPLEASWNAARAIRAVPETVGETGPHPARPRAVSTFLKVWWATWRALWTWTPEFRHERSKLIKFFVLLTVTAMILGALAAVIHLYV